ncbi:MAG: septum formation initiator family protein [Ruminococcaceae bacterium]|nr:septum formation initiator family protein [Oscillospiraceae bacterium]
MGAWAIRVHIREAEDMAQSKKKKPAKARTGFFTKVLIVILLAVLTWQLGALRTQVEDAEFQRQQLAAQVDAKQAENNSLQASIDRGGSLEEMLRIAREELGLVAPNEKVFYDNSN